MVLVGYITVPLYILYVEVISVYLCLQKGCQNKNNRAKQKLRLRARYNVQVKIILHNIKQEYDTS